MLRIRYILVPTDFSEHAAQAVTAALHLAEMHHARVELIHVIEEPTFPAFYNMGVKALSGELPRLEVTAHRAMEKMVQELPGPDPAHGFGVRVDTGKPYEVITRWAKHRGVDLIMLSSHGLTGLERLLMGSVAEQVVRHAPCSVFVVKAFGPRL